MARPVRKGWNPARETTSAGRCRRVATLAGDASSAYLVVCHVKLVPGGIAAAAEDARRMVAAFRPDSMGTGLDSPE